VIPLEDARAKVLSRIAPHAPLAPVEAAHRDMAGRVLAEDVVAPEDVPPFANSAVDGYAVRVEDLGAVPLRLPVIGTVRAGASGLDHPVAPGTAVRIMTGAPVPPGADAVVMVEDTDGTPEATEVTIGAMPTTGQHIRPAGDDVVPGDVVVAAGTVLGPAHLGVLATVGVTELDVVPRPRVAVVSTGDELVGDGRPLGPGQIRDSNRLGLLALLRTYGYETVDLGLVADDEAAIEAVLREGAERADALVTTGGVSMGDFDYVKVVLDRIGDMRWMQVAIKPAKPLAFGTIARVDGGRVPVFGLPGNPVSSFVTFLLFVQPFLWRLQGGRDEPLPRLPLRADFDWPRPDRRREFLRARVNARGGLDLFPNQGSGVLTSTVWADGLIDNPPGQAIRAGDTVQFIAFGGRT